MIGTTFEQELAKNPDLIDRDEVLELFSIALNNYQEASQKHISDNYEAGIWAGKIDACQFLMKIVERAKGR